MSEPDESPTTPYWRTIGLKIIVAAVLGLILSFGLCQVGFRLDRNIHDEGPSGIDTLGLLGLALSAIALLVGILVAIIQGLSRLFRKT
jgi:hypothetical protein